MAKQKVSLTTTSSNAFFAAVPKLKTQTVELDGQSVKIREMSVGERLDFERETAGKTNGEIVLAVILASVVDDNGNQLFTEGDLARLKALPSDFVQPLAAAILSINGLTDDDMDDLKKN